MMNVMNNNYNIDNTFKSKSLLSKKSFSLREEKKVVMKLRAAQNDGDKQEPLGKAINEGQTDLMKPSKVTTPDIGVKKVKRKRKSPLIPWKKPEGMPKRPLSAYNLFFQDRRKSIMEAATENCEKLNEDPKYSNRKSTKKRSGVGFANLARTIGTEWRALDPEKKSPYENRAASDKERYDKEMLVWRAKEKEAKALREANAAANTQPFDCANMMPPFSAKTMDGSLLGAGDSADFLALQDPESRGLFNASIFNNYGNNPYMMDTQSNQPSNIPVRQQQDASPYNKRHLTAFSNSLVNDQLRQNTMARDNFPFNIGGMGFGGDSQAAQSYPHPAQSFLPSGGVGTSGHKAMFWNNPRMENAAAGSADLEPLPLPDQQQHQLNHQEMLLQKATQMIWSGHHAMQAKDQQQMNSPATGGQYSQRLPVGRTWGQNPSSWHDKNMNTVDTNDPIQVNQEVPLTNDVASTPANIPSQEMGNDPMDDAKDSSTHDPWNPLDLEEPN